jgi:DNA-directed RNA polymerase subunit F
MNRLNLNSSPLIGEILLEVREAQDDGIIKNKDEALIYIEKFVSLGE